jgi:hypothetical protein
MRLRTDLQAAAEHLPACFVSLCPFPVCEPYSVGGARSTCKSRPHCHSLACGREALYVRPQSLLDAIHTRCTEVRLLDGNLHSLNRQSSPQTRTPVPALPWQWAFHMLPRVVIAGSPISSATCMDSHFLDKTNSGFGVLPCCQPFQPPSPRSRPVSPAVLLCGPTPWVSDPHCCDGLPRPSTAKRHSPAL